MELRMKTHQVKCAEIDYDSDVNLLPILDEDKNKQDDYPKQDGRLIVFGFKRDFVWNKDGSLNLLGSGTYGSVIKVKKISDGNTYALKIIRYDSEQSDQMKKTIEEVHRLAALDPHSNLIRYFDCWVEDFEEKLPYGDIEKDEDRTLSKKNFRLPVDAHVDENSCEDDFGIVFESNIKSVPRGDNNPNTREARTGDQYLLFLTALYDKSLSDWYGKNIFPRKFRENFEIDCMLQLSSAMLHCHKRNIIHGDLNSGNILVVNYDKSSPKINLVIGDFGLSNGTVEYMSPEKMKVWRSIADLKLCETEEKAQLEEKVNVMKTKITNATDVYTMGLVFAELICRVEKEAEKWTNFQLDQDNKPVIHDDFYPPKASQELRKIIKKMTEDKASLRCSFEVVVKELDKLACR